MYPVFEGAIPIAYPFYPKLDPKEPVYKKLKIIEDKQYDKGKKKIFTKFSNEQKSIGVSYSFHLGDILRRPIVTRPCSMEPFLAEPSYFRKREVLPSINSLLSNTPTIEYNMQLPPPVLSYDRYVYTKWPFLVVLRRISALAQTRPQHCG